MAPHGSREVPETAKDIKFWMELVVAGAAATGALSVLAWGTYRTGAAAWVWAAAYKIWKGEHSERDVHALRAGRERGGERTQRIIGDIETAAETGARGGNEGMARLNQALKTGVSPPMSRSSSFSGSESGGVPLRLLTSRGEDLMEAERLLDQKKRELEEEQKRVERAHREIERQRILVEQQQKEQADRLAKMSLNQNQPEPYTDSEEPSSSKGKGKAPALPVKSKKCRHGNSTKHCNKCRRKP